MKRNYIILNLFIASQLCATSAPAPMPKLPLGLESQYARIVRVLRLAKVIDPALRKQADELVVRLRDAGGEPQAETILRLLGTLPEQEVPSKKEMPKEEEKERAEQAPQPKPAIPEQPAVSGPKPTITAIPVRVSAMMRGKPEEIVLADEEPLTTETYGEILERQKEHNDPMILARVVTSERPGAPLFVHYYDAYTYNILRFGNNYPLSGPLQIKEQNNPLNRLPIQGKVQYFIYNPKEPELGFQFAFTEADVIDNPENRLIIDKYQNMDAARKKEAEERAAGEWVPAPKPYIQEVLLPQQPMVPGSHWSSWNPAESTPENQLALGIISYDMQHHRQAREYFERSANQAENPTIRGKAQYYLGKMSFAGDGLPKNYLVAQQYLDRAVTSGALNEWERVQAGLALTIIRDQKEDEMLKEALAESKALAEQKEKEKAARFAKELKEKREQIATNSLNATNEKRLMDNLEALEDVFKQNNMTAQIKLVKDALDSLRTSGKMGGYGISQPLYIEALLRGIDRNMKIKYFGQDTTLSVFLDPIRDLLNAEIKRFGGK